jgi:predicted HTH domain antitoxin
MPASMSFDIPSDVLESARMTVRDAKLELAIALFARDRLSMGKAAELAVEDALEDSAALAAFRRS